MASISEQPADSRIIVAEQDGALSFNVPRQGLRRGGGGIYLFAMVWCSIVVVITVVFATAFFAGRANGGDVAAWIIFGVLAVFWLIGAGFMLAAVNMARRRAGIVVADGQVSVLKTGLFGSKTRTWTRDDLLMVRMGASGMMINHRPVLELQFVPYRGKKFGMLVGHDEADLAWLATKISTSLGMQDGASIANQVLCDIERAPPNTRIVVESTPSSMTLSIPPAGLWRGSLGAFPLGIAWFILAGSVIVGIMTLLPSALDPGVLCMATFVILLFGSGLIAIGVYLGTRRAEFAVADGRMLLVHDSMMGKKRNEWPAGALVAIRAKPSDISVNNQPLFQLEIVPHSGMPITLLTGRDELELAWIATVLRRQLDLPPEAEAHEPEKDANERE